MNRAGGYILVMISIIMVSMHYGQQKDYVLVRPVLTILSSPIGLPAYGYQGHEAVLRSLRNGLNSLGISYNVNPNSIDEIADTVIVTAQIVALYQAIGLKKRGVIKYLIAGPNIIDRPQSYSGMLAYSEIDCYLVPSRWVRLLFAADEPLLSNKLFVWHAGVDAQEWYPSVAKQPSKEVLLYYKNGPEILYNNIEQLLQKNGWQTHRLVYGSYTKNEYQELLSRVRFAVFMSKSETQGIALAEAWAMNVPTLVWDPGSSYNHGDWYQDISAAPYITAHTGAPWQTLHDFQTIIESIERHVDQYSPRAWVTEYMTDQVSVRYLAKIIESVKSKKRFIL